MSTCLIGEADPFIARLLARYAEACGLVPLRATTGEEVLALAHSVRPLVVVLEVQLPGDVAGWEAVVALRQAEDTSHLPIVTCSWLDLAEARELTGPVTGHLHKPDLPFANFVAALHAARVMPDGAPSGGQASSAHGGA